MTSLSLKRMAERRLKSGHLWVFSNELETLPKLDPGSQVIVKSNRGESFGSGFYNPHSLISIRMLLTNELIDADFFTERFGEALELRKCLLPGENTYRLMFGESDLLPGLVIDKFEDFLSLQILSAGFEKNKELLLESLHRFFPEIKGIYEKNDSALRELEVLPQQTGVLTGEIPDEIITSEEGITLSIRIKSGQKTGYYLDQRMNRMAIRKIAEGKSVLDCFCNQGGFALNAALAGAEKVVAVDSSELALEAGKSNAKLNKFKNIDFEKSDVFDFLQEEIRKQQPWDFIILDPPAFAKTKKNVPTAKAGYAKLNRLAMNLLPRGGFLATSSCSQHIREDVFSEIIQKEAAKLGRRPKLIYRGMQSPDHPILPAMPETRYLKFMIFQVY